MAAAAAAHNETTSSWPLPPSAPNYQQSSTPSSPWRFSYPPSTLDDETEESDSDCTPQGNGMPEKAKTESPPKSAITGGIPCYFEESGYSSLPPPPPLCTYADMEQVIKKEKHEVTEPEQSLSRASAQLSSQAILVSRILKGMPQSPHFLHLKGYSDIAKDSLVNAWDRIFEQLVDRIQSMQVNSFWVDAKRLWETMGELQKMGYNVVAVRRRLVELTDVMLRLRRHRSAIRELKCRAEEHWMEKCRLEYEIMKLRNRVEAEKARHEEVMVKVEKMEQEMPRFHDVFCGIATEKIKIC